MAALGEDPIGDILTLPTGRVQCLLCGKDFVNASKAMRHIRTIHEASQSSRWEVNCEICSKTFKHEIYMKDHMRKTHNIKMGSGYKRAFQPESKT